MDQHRKIRVWWIVLLVVAGSLSFSTIQPRMAASATNHASVLYVGGSGPGNYSKIQDAVENASDGDTVFVYDDAAPYFESVVINVSIDLIGENRNTTSIEGGEYAISIYVDGVTVRGFRISNVGDFWNCCGFYVTSRGNTISDNNIMNNLRMNGVFLNGASYTQVSGNLIVNNQYHGIRLEYGSHNEIMNNVIVNNRGYGIYLFEAQENLLVGNTVRQSFYDGLLLGEYCENNVIYHNNFIDNPGNAYDTTGNVWDNGSSGNYWSDYTGIDIDGDGIGDTVYQVPGNVSQDRFPLMVPFESRPVDIECMIKGGFGLTIRVTNQGAEDVLFLDWESHLTGGLLLLPLRRSSHGSILYLGVGEELVLQKVDAWAGVGIIEVTASVGSTTESVQGLLLFFLFVLLTNSQYSLKSPGRFV